MRRCSAGRQNFAGVRSGKRSGRSDTRDLRQWPFAHALDAGPSAVPTPTLVRYVITISRGRRRSRLRSSVNRHKRTQRTTSSSASCPSIARRVNRRALGRRRRARTADTRSGTPIRRSSCSEARGGGYSRRSSQLQPCFCSPASRATRHRTTVPASPPTPPRIDIRIPSNTSTSAAPDRQQAQLAWTYDAIRSHYDQGRGWEWYFSEPALSAERGVMDYRARNVLLDQELQLVGRPDRLRSITVYSSKKGRCPADR